MKDRLGRLIVVTRYLIYLNAGITAWLFAKSLHEGEFFAMGMMAVCTFVSLNVAKGLR